MINIGLEDVWINQKTRVGTLHSASLLCLLYHIVTLHAVTVTYP
jgi:hypothetical protein